MAFRRFFLPLMILGVCQVGWAQSPTYGFGRTPSAEEIHDWDIAISPTGEELPPGRGTAKEGAKLYVQKGCAGCHGATGSGGRAPNLIKPEDMPANPAPGRTAGLEMGAPGIIALRAPYAVVIWSFINRGMPLYREGSLKADEVYSLVAYLLYKNGVIGEDEVMGPESLPRVKMPNRDGFVPPPDWKHGTPRVQGYP